MTRHCAPIRLGIRILLVVAFALAPFSATLLMSHDSAHIQRASADHTPCPMHGTVDPGDSGHTPSGLADQQGQHCQCGLFCHAVFALIAPAAYAPPPGRAVLADLATVIADGHWPPPLPRPPQT